MRVDAATQFGGDGCGAASVAVTTDARGRWSLPLEYPASLHGGAARALVTARGDHAWSSTSDGYSLSWGVKGARGS